jgi:hypothetical protein
MSPGRPKDACKSLATFRLIALKRETFPTLAGYKNPLAFLQGEIL